MKRIKIASIACIALLSLFACSGNKAPQIGYFPVSTPEAQGVSTESILAFLDAAEASGVEIHSFMFLRHGKLIAEGWWNPYAADLKHSMYSASKSFTSIAIGLAVDEGLITVEDQAISFFPDQVPDTISTHLAAIKIKDLLTMRPGSERDMQFPLVATETNWIKSYFATSFPFEPGTTFRYNSMATYTLSAIVQKVTGKKMIDYLTEHLFVPMDIEGADWEIDPMGINTGGWGLRLKTEDMAKVGQMLLQKGVWNGKQLLSSEWIADATSKKVEMGPPPGSSGGDRPTTGYGYQFWITRNGYMAFGAMGQYIFVFPELDAVIAITAGDGGDSQGLVWEHIVPAMKTEALPPNEALNGQLTKRLQSLALPKPEKGSSTPATAVIQGKTYRLAPNEQKLESVGFTLKGDDYILTMAADGKTYDLAFGNDRWVFGETAKPGPNLVDKAINHLATLATNKIAGCYAWKDATTLELMLRYIESPHYEVYTFVFDGEQLTLQKQISYIKEAIQFAGVAAGNS